MAKKRNIILLLLSLTFCKLTKAQSTSGSSFNLNIKSGLPSNHIYGILKDKYGYLWFATPKGVARYNGYEFKTFGLQEGLPYEDIWQLLEDKKGRIWLMNLGMEIGYLLNGKYHKAFLKNITTELYPREVRDLDNGIMFTSSCINGINTRTSLCIEKNDTITRVEIPDSLYNTQQKNVPISKKLDEMPFVLSSGKTGMVFLNSLYDFNIKDTTIKITRRATVSEVAQHPDMIEGAHYYSIGNFLFISGLFDTIKTSFSYVNLSTGSITHLKNKDLGLNEKIEHVYYDRLRGNDSTLYVITTNNIVKISVTNNVIDKDRYIIKDLIPHPEIQGKDIKVFSTDRLWGNIIGTNTLGAWLNATSVNHFVKMPQIKLDKFKFIGGKTDGISFWRNQTSSTLAKLDSNFHVTYIKYPGEGIINQITHYNADTFWATGTAMFDVYHFNNNTNTFKKTGLSSAMASTGISIHTTISFRQTSDSAFILLNARYFLKTEIQGGVCHTFKIDIAKYTDLVYDSVRKNFWAYNTNRITISNGTDKTIIPKEKLPCFGIASIKKIVIDNKYGNIFLMGNNAGESKVTMYCPETNSYKELFENYNLKEANLFIYHDKIIIAGKMGVLFSKISGKNKVIGSLLYRNIKNCNYENITDVQLSFNKLLLNTDKGFYTVSIPSDSEIINHNTHEENNYKLLTIYNDSIFNIHQYDTIILDQKDHRLQFDLINPFGNGKVKYSYKIGENGNWRQLNSNELTLPHSLIPGRFYNLFIRVNDDVWKSKAIVLRICVKPYWWQALYYSKLFWLFATSFLLALLVLVIYISNRIITKNQIKKNLRLELELKSIYAQINPHFIFNTLNSALLLVSKNNMDEAYAHISKFSRLLRSYIKSSRNRMITLEEEINNLRNYIELQQVRFKDKFSYTIKYNEDINLSEMKIPSLLLQPFIENAINHGLLPKKEPGNLILELQYTEAKNVLICIIGDDGIGRTAGGKINETRNKTDESYGNLMIKDLVRIFNKYEKLKIDIEYIDKTEPATGTTVIIRIKYPAKR